MNSLLIYSNLLELFCKAKENKDKGSRLQTSDLDRLCLYFVMNIHTLFLCTSVTIQCLLRAQL